MGRRDNNRDRETRQRMKLLIDLMDWAYYQGKNDTSESLYHRWKWDEISKALKKAKK